MNPFERLTGALQFQISNTLGFQELRDVQLLSIDAILDGKNSVILAPTAGGKTEAAFFPLLSAMDAGDWKPVSVLYLSPIRALLNNQEHRVARYAETIGRRSFKWHGDTTQGERKSFLRDPADILLTTPESLEAMLMSTRVPVARLFAGLRAVVIDEVHAFAGDDRGAHLASVLERLSRFCGNDVQRIGLSATVGNPDAILRWVQGRSEREGIIISPPKPKTAPVISLDYVASLPNAAKVVKALHPGKKRLVFVESRRAVEELGRYLRQEEVDTYLIHGSLAQEERRDTERAFSEGQNCVVVATSALELGIDVGDLDHVLQIDSPSKVASFLQRMGRTGRRPGTNSNCTFLEAKRDATIQAAALLRLHAQGFVEDVRPSRRAFHILAHQLLALCIQHRGIGRGEWFAWIDGATPFADITVDERRVLLEHMLASTILTDQDGRLWLGAEGEKRYGRRNFEELYAVFDVPRYVTVQWNTQEIGSVDADFLSSLDPEKGRPAFTLGGRAWEIQNIEWKRGVCQVKPAEHAGAPRWTGTPSFLSYALSQSMREVLIGGDEQPSWSARAREIIASLRAEHGFLRDSESPILDEAAGITWWNYAGGHANVLLARMIEAELGGRCVVRNASITWKEAPSPSIAALTETLRAFRRDQRPSHEDAIRFAQACAGKLRFSKFQPYLPEALLDEFLASRLDVDGARRALATRG